MRGIPLIKLSVALVILIAFGLVRLPLESKIETKLRAQLYVDDKVDLPMMDKLGQGGFAAALGGFRPLVANIYYLIAFSQAMDENEWGRVDQTYGLISTLQPRNSHYREQHVWQLGWNAYAWANGEAEYQERLGNDWKASNLETFTAPGYVKRAEEVALKGAKEIKNDYRFYQRVGSLYDEKLNNRCEAARWFKMGSEIEGAPSFMHSIYVIFLADCEGSEDVVYPLLQERYWSEGPRGRSPSVIVKMNQVESRLAQREIDAKGFEEVQRLAAAETDGYMHRVALAQYHTTVEKAPRKAIAIYEDMLKPGGPEVPQYYKMKWAMLSSQIPGKEEISYRTMREVLIGSRRRLNPEEEAVIRPLEDHLDIPQEARLFPKREKTKSP